MSARGFTLIELSVSLGILSLLITGSIILVTLNVDANRQAETIGKILVLKRAIVGDARIVTKESRTDFGYVGDMGSLPSSLQDLWIKGSQPGYDYNNSKRTGAGWGGPYVDVGPIELASDLTRDAWGNTVQYIVGTGTSSVTGQEYRARLISYGSDGNLGGSDDITVEIYKPEVVSTVVSYVRDSAGNPMSGVSVLMNYPSNGALTTSATTSAADGSYSFSNIPIGNRSVTIEPKLAYSEGSGISTSGGGGTTVEFVILSFSCGTISTMTASYDVTAFYQRLWVGKDQVFNDALDLAGSGELVTFDSPVDISGSGCSGGGTGIVQVFPVRVQSGFTQVSDQDIGSGSNAAATSIRVRMENFKALEGGGGANVDMTGISITVLFSDGSTATFSPVHR